MKNRIFAILMCLVLMIGVLPVTAMAAEIVDSGKCGENVTWTLTSKGVLTISGEGEMEDYLAYPYDYDYYHKAPWLSASEDASTVIIEDGVTRIGNNVFSDINNCEITIPGSVIEIGEDAFQNIPNLLSISVSENNKYFCIGEKGELFSKDKSVLIKVPTYISGEYVIPDSVTKIENYAFENCDRLNFIIIPDSVIEIGEYAFGYCEYLKKITIPESVTKIDPDAFYRCYSLKRIAVDENNPMYSSDKNGALLDKEKKTLLYVPSELTKYTVPESVKSVDSNAFQSINIHSLGKGLKKIRFTGNAPDFGDEYYFNSKLLKWDYEVKVYYPKKDATWDWILFTCPDKVTWIPYTPIGTFGWVCIGVAGVVVLGGVGFGTNKLIKKSKNTKTERGTENEE